MTAVTPTRMHTALFLTIGLLLLPGMAFAQHAHHPSSLQASAPKEPKKADQAKEQGTGTADDAPAHVGHGEQALAPVDQQRGRTGKPIDHGAMDVDHGSMEHGSAEQAGSHGPETHHRTSPPQQRTPIPRVTDADRAAAVSPPSDHPVHDNGIYSYVLFNRLEGWDADPGTALGWEGQAWIGTDLNRVWLRSEGERTAGHTESADLEVLYGRSVAPWWDLVAGVRHDFQPGGSQNFAAIGVVGLAPYKFEVEATAYLGESGQTAARLEVEYETLLTNRLILQPLVELNFYGKSDERRGIGSGLSTAEAGLRLRYEFTRQFAPYIGVVHERAFGRTADLRREGGEDVNDTRFVAGIRIWF